MSSSGKRHFERQRQHAVLSVANRPTWTFAIIVGAGFHLREPSVTDRRRSSRVTTQPQQLLVGGPTPNSSVYRVDIKTHTVSSCATITMLNYCPRIVVWLHLCASVVQLFNNLTKYKVQNCILACGKRKLQLVIWGLTRRWRVALH